MSGPPRVTSSGAAERGEEALVDGEDAGDRVGLRGRVPFIDLEGAAEEDAVGAREHVAVAEVGVIHLWLRLEDRELTARGMQVLVAEQLAAAEARAVEDQALGKRRQIRRACELADLDLAAGDLNIPEHLAKVAAGLDVHGVVAEHILIGERMLGPGQRAIDRREGRD